MSDVVVVVHRDTLFPRPIARHAALQLLVIVTDSNLISSQPIHYHDEINAEYYFAH